MLVMLALSKVESEQLTTANNSEKATTSKRRLQYRSAMACCAYNSWDSEKATTYFLRLHAMIGG